MHLSMWITQFLISSSSSSSSSFFFKRILFNNIKHVRFGPCTFPCGSEEYALLVVTNDWRRFSCWEPLGNMKGLQAIYNWWKMLAGRTLFIADIKTVNLTVTFNLMNYLAFTLYHKLLMLIYYKMCITGLWTRFLLVDFYMCIALTYNQHCWLGVN